MMLVRWFTFSKKFKAREQNSGVDHKPPPFQAYLLSPALARDWAKLRELLLALRSLNVKVTWEKLSCQQADVLISEVSSVTKPVTVWASPKPGWTNLLRVIPLKSKGSPTDPTRGQQQKSLPALSTHTSLHPTCPWENQGSKRDHLDKWVYFITEFQNQEES
jgi:hypothetical protein